MKSKYIASLVEFFTAAFLLSACITSGTSFTNTLPTQTPTIIPQELQTHETLIDQTLTFTPFITETPTFEITPEITPEITATPFFVLPSTRDELIELIEKTYSLDPETVIDVLRTNTIQIYQLSFSITPAEIDLSSETVKIFEIAENPTHTKRAFIACQESESCKKRVYIEDEMTLDVTMISSTNYYDDLADLIWIGDDRLAFGVNLGVKAAEYVVIDVKNDSLELCLRVFSQ